MKTLVLLLALSSLTAPAMSQCDKEKWKRLAGEVGLVLVAEVGEVGLSQRAWSGHIASAQRVKFKAIKVLKGQLSSSTLEVEYYLVKNDPLADTKQPRLSPEIFKVGNQLVLFLEPDPKKDEAYFTAARNRGTVKADADMLKMLSNLPDAAR
jgi:hypothetical protein